ncbi:hypothetical protein QBC42DRAFT_344554 [Cladorrhinum samala]|uniref:Uncharacterized protein n=1 Tax=Cladorrhinum samala TaxID=585594 RepID=A0AAV9HYD1_9PEZI|nr:hypothetical protein QBC42DRAFT_344554 [Cladorrhinum samala]
MVLAAASAGVKRLVTLDNVVENAEMVVSMNQENGKEVKTPGGTSSWGGEQGMFWRNVLEKVLEKVLEERFGGMHHMTPKKAGIQRTCDFLDGNRDRIPFNISKNDVFRFNGVSKAMGWKILSQPREIDGRTFYTAHNETRGRKKLITKEDLAKIERFIDSNGFDGRTVGWAGLPAAAGLDIDCSARTVYRAVKDINLYMYIACTKKYISPHAKERRVEYARVMLEKYLNKEDWYHVRFSDECHFGYGPQGRVHIIRRP